MHLVSLAFSARFSRSELGASENRISGFSGRPIRDAKLSQNGVSKFGSASLMKLGMCFGFPRSAYTFSRCFTLGHNSSQRKKAKRRKRHDKSEHKMYVKLVQ